MSLLMLATRVVARPLQFLAPTRTLSLAFSATRLAPSAPSAAAVTSHEAVASRQAGGAMPRGAGEDQRRPADDLGADSLDTVELVMAFEEEFGVEIPDDAAEKILTVKDAISYIQEHAAS